MLGFGGTADHDTDGLVGVFGCRANGADRRLDDGCLGALRAESDGQVAATDEDAIDTFRGDDGVALVQRLGILDHRDAADSDHPAAPHAPTSLARHSVLLAANW